MNGIRATTDKIAQRAFFAALALVAGCSGPIETRIASAGDGVPGNASVAIRPYDMSIPHADWITARDAIKATLAEKGHAIADASPLAMDIAVSARPAVTGVAGANGQAVSPVKPHRLLQSCRDQVYRLVVVVVDSASGRLLYRGSAEEYHCRARLADTLAVLSRRALADIDHPGSNRIESRAGME